MSNERRVKETKAYVLLYRVVTYAGRLVCHTTVLLCLIIGGGTVLAQFGDGAPPGKYSLSFFLLLGVSGLFLIYVGAAAGLARGGRSLTEKELDDRDPIDHLFVMLAIVVTFLFGAAVWVVVDILAQPAFIRGVIDLVIPPALGGYVAWEALRGPPGKRGAAASETP